MKNRIACLVWIGLTAGNLQGVTWAQTLSDVELGRRDFAKLCANCHGDDGKGKGRSAKLMATVPADLTRIAERRSGKFPADTIAKFIDGRYRQPGDASSGMPAWGYVLGAHSTAKTTPAKDREIAVTIRRIVAYLETIQTAAAVKPRRPKKSPPGS